VVGGTFSSIGAAIAAIERDIKTKERKLDGVVRKTARATRNDVIRNVPRAFGELAASIHVEDGPIGKSSVVADAPHASAVEVGSRPHTPPLAPLIAWVQLRGIQGLTPGGRVRRSVPPRREAARAIAASLHPKLGGNAGAAAWRQRAMIQGSLADADPAVVAIARAIQRAITLRGTKPHRFMAQGVNDAMAHLASLVPAALSSD